MVNHNTQSETDMRAFYASLKPSDTTSQSHAVTLKSSENTKKSLHILQDLFSKDFSLLIHPGRSIQMKESLRYLLNLPQNEGFCLTTKSEIQKLLQCFERWSFKYHKASGLSAAAETELSKASEVMNDLDTNVQEFRNIEKEETCLSNKLVCLQEEKRMLEEKIKTLDADIKVSTKRRDMFRKRKMELYQKGREVKAKRDDLMINVPRLKTEQDLAGKTRDNIEAEWSKLREQFIRSTGIKELI